jgi:hypothetical protein
LGQQAETVAGEIERYCIAHPEARDTADGISWWVQMQRQEDIRNTVPAAIQLLLERGVLERSTSADGSALYGYRVADTK